MVNSEKINTFVKQLNYLINLKNNIMLQKEIAYRKNGATKTTNATRVAKLNTLLESHIIDGTTSFEWKHYGLKGSMVSFTPELAVELLENHNNENRKIKKYNVNFLISEMESGNWKLNGETITFDYKGDLTNGQHRLLAVIATGIPILTLTITGLNPDTFKTIDTGTNRSASDVLGVNNVPNAAHVAATVKFIYSFKNGKYGSNLHSHRTLSNSDLLEYYYSLGETKISQCVKFYNSVKSSGLLRPRLVSGLYYLMAEIDENDAKEFLTSLCNGFNLTEKSPINALRNKIIKTKFDKNYRLTNLDLLLLITYVWNKYRNNEKCKNIRLPNDYIPHLI